MVVSCSECGTEFDAVRSSARLCSARCRQKASRRARSENHAEQRSKVVELAARKPAARRASQPGTTTHRGALSVETRVLTELGDGSDTAMGQACLLIARRLDDQVDASGAAVSSLVGRLEKLMDAILSARVVDEVEKDQTNPVTFLQRRGEERLRNAGVG